MRRLPGCRLRRPAPPRAAGARAWLAAVVLGLLATCAGGCDLFKPATPESGGGGAFLLPNYTDPESCLHYMRLGIERKDNVGQNAYIGAFADPVRDGIGFHAYFDLAVWNAYTGTKPEDWDLGHENLFYFSFIRLTGDPYEMRWLPDASHPDEPPLGDTAVVHRRYEVRALRAVTADSLLIAVGYADLYFARISASRWALSRWMDHLAPGVTAQPEDPQTFGARRLGSGSQ